MVEDARNAPAADTHLATLDLLRGVAITGVVIYHLIASSFPSGWWFDSNWPIAVMGTWATNGWLGVNLFFIASGFVLYLPFARGQREIHGARDIAQFYKRRAFRLLPLFYVSTLLLVAISPSPWPKQEVILLTLTFNFNADTFMPGVNFVLWSLGIEVWFSLIFPFLVASINRFGWQLVGACVFVAAITLRALGAPTDESVVGHSVPYINPLKDSVIGRLDDFFVGMVLAAMHGAGFRCASPRAAATAGVLACTTAAVLVDLAASRMLPWETMIFSNTMFQAGCAGIVVAMLAMTQLRFRPLELLGMMSYSLYIWHGVIIKHASAGPQSVSATARMAVLLAGVVWMSYRYIEFGHIKSIGRLLPAAPERAGRPAEPLTKCRS